MTSAALDLFIEDGRKRISARDTSSYEEKIRLLVEACHPKQRDFVVDNHRRVCALVARGGGKTTAARARIVTTMLRTRKARCLFIATTRSQAEDLLWLPLKDLVEKLGIEAKFNETKFRCEFLRNKSTVRLVGADDKREIDKLRGIPFHTVGIDEAASYQPMLLEHLIFRIIGPRLGDYGGNLFMFGTPSHILHGPFYDATRHGSEISRPYSDRRLPEYADWQGWSVHKWCLEDGAPHVPAMYKLWEEAKLEKKANGWGDDHPVWLREYRGEWADDDTENVFKYRAYAESGEPHNMWDPPKLNNKIAKLPEGNDWRYVYGIDMGHSDPFALDIFAWDAQATTKTLYHVYSFEKKEMYAKTIAELLIGTELNSDKLGGLFALTGWPDGIVADCAGLGGAVLAELLNVYGIQIKPAEKKNKHDSIELFNGDLIDGRIKILKGSQLETQLRTLQWDTDDYGNLKERKGVPNHNADAAIYARREANHLFSQEAPPKPGFFPPRQTDTLEDDEPESGEFDDLLSDTSFNDFF